MSVIFEIHTTDCLTISIILTEPKRVQVFAVTPLASTATEWVPAGSVMARLCPMEYGAAEYECAWLRVRRRGSKPMKTIDDDINNRTLL